MKYQLDMTAGAFPSLLSILALAILPGCETSAPQPPSAITLCELRDNEASFQDRTIRLRAVWVTEFRHGALLIDAQCTGYALLPESSEPEDSSLLAFERALNEPAPLRTNRFPTAFNVELVGAFVGERGDLRNVFLIDEVLSFDRPADSLAACAWACTGDW